MGVEHAAQVFAGDEFRQFAGSGAFDFVAGFAQLGRDERQVQRGIDVVFGFAGENAVFLRRPVSSSVQPCFAARARKRSMC